MGRVLYIIEKFTDGICIFLMSVAFLITFAHIVGRYVFKTPIFFSEELSRYCFIWSCMLGASIVNRKDEHTSVTYFVSLIPLKLQHILYIIRQLAILILLCALTYYGIFLSIKMRTVLTAAMEISWAIVYMALPTASLLLIISTLRLLIQKVSELRSMVRG